MFINFIAAAQFPFFGIVLFISGTQIEQINNKILLIFFAVVVLAVFATLTYEIHCTNRNDWWSECVKHLAEHSDYYDEAIEIFNWSKQLVMRSSSCSRNKFENTNICTLASEKNGLLLLFCETVFFILQSSSDDIVKAESKWSLYWALFIRKPTNTNRIRC